MSELCREFELQIWEKSLYFGIDKGKSVTANRTIAEIDFRTNKNKGDVTYAILGRIVKRTSASQE